MMARGQSADLHIKDDSTRRIRRKLVGSSPGQFLTYSAEIGGKLVRRSYTIVSSASHTAYIETTIKREDSGLFSEYMHDKIASFAFSRKSTGACS